MFSLFRENLRIALDSIRSQMLRTILTVVIIGIGIWALVGILGLVNVLSDNIAGNFESMGSNTFNIQRYDINFDSNRGGRKRKTNPIISYNNVREFTDLYQFPTAQTSVSFVGTATAEVKFENEKTDPEVQVYGTNENFLENAGVKVDQGRNFTKFDVENNTKVCLIGSDFLKSLFKNDAPLEKTITVRGVKFKVIGVLESQGSTFGNNQDLRVIIPIQVARGMFTQPNINYNISVKVDDNELMDQAQDEAIITLRNIRKLTPLDKNNFGIVRSDDLLNQIAEIGGALSMAAIIISGITIAGSSIALMNIMLVSVTERTREIGVRKALGAKRSTISIQFFIETIVIGQIGSLFGIVLGLVTIWAISYGFDTDFELPVGAMIAATIVTFIVALAAGAYPATKAAKLDPVESLRYE